MTGRRRIYYRLKRLEAESRVIIFGKKLVIDVNTSKLILIKYLQNPRVTGNTFPLGV